MNARSGEHLLSPTGGGGTPVGKRSSAVLQTGVNMGAVLAGLDDDDYNSEDDGPPTAPLAPTAPTGSVNNHRPYVGGFAAAAFEAARHSAAAAAAKKEDKKKKQIGSGSQTFGSRRSA